LPEKSAVLRREANNRVRLTSGAAEFNIVGQPAEDYPPFPRSEKVNFVAVDPTALLEMIEKTQFAISADETRHNLNGVFFESGEGDVRMVATDGHRLSLVQRRLEGQFNLKRGVIVPRKGLFELRRLLSEDQTGTCQLGFNARYLMDVLQVVDAEQMKVELCDELSPGVLKPAGEPGAGARYTAVIMPMRI